MRRGPAIGLVVVGIGLVIAPVIFQMFDRAPKGAEMLVDFKPFMTDQRLGRFERYMRDIDGAVQEVDGELRPALAARAGIDDAQFEQRFATFVAFAREWPTIDSDMSDMLRRVHTNLENYEAVDALPNFELFPWFFVAPGILIALAGTVALVRPRRAGIALVFAAVVGVGLIAAPAVFQMFERAPKGGDMLDAFESIMTRKRVQTIQGYFATMSVGQGAMRIDLLPAARDEAGFTDAELSQAFPKTVALDSDWIGILNDMTPMIGAMSDNVDNYEAIKALPPFPLFPWFFVAGGLATAVLALVARRGPTRVERLCQPPIDQPPIDCPPRQRRKEILPWRITDFGSPRCWSHLP
jgi:hypothetical protein